MTNHVVRLYAFAGALLVLFLTWAAIAAPPWAPTAARRPTPAGRRWPRESRGSATSRIVVQRVVAQRWRVYRVRLASRRRAISAAVSRHQRQLAAAQRVSAASRRRTPTPSSGYSAAPSVRVVTLPPVTITRTS